jgi:hypothetical protein
MRQNITFFVPWCVPSCRSHNVKTGFLAYEVLLGLFVIGRVINRQFLELRLSGLSVDRNLRMLQGMQTQRVRNRGFGLC